MNQIKHSYNQILHLIIALNIAVKFVSFVNFYLKKQLLNKMLVKKLFHV
ncbi:hypothetical protein NT05LI_3430, partial [Listeria ivanovii FSL F6-596]